MRLEAYTADKKLAKALDAYATDTFGGATIVKASGNSERWGRERSYIVITFTDDADKSHALKLWVNAVDDHLWYSTEESVLVTFDNDHLFVERSGS